MLRGRRSEPMLARQQRGKCPGMQNPPPSPGEQPVVRSGFRAVLGRGLALPALRAAAAASVPACLPAGCCAPSEMVLVRSGSPSPKRPAAPSPPPPPACRSPGGAAGRRCRLRNFNWEALPAERVRSGRNVWAAAAAAGGFGLDVALLEELFGQRAPEAGGAGSLRCGATPEQASLLDSKKILNLGIFLKQFKRPVQAIVADIRDGAGALYGAEKLLELAKMLPDMEEAKKLVAFQGSQSRLSEAERFALLLVQVPSYAHRLELLVLKEEFFPQLNVLQSAVQIMTEAALELLGCVELHNLIRLVLEAGNYINEGGYAGSALGFRMSSLLRLADTKANKPGMDLLHFVALEAEKKDPRLLFFPRKLPHVGPASRGQFPIWVLAGYIGCLLEDGFPDRGQALIPGGPLPASSDVSCGSERELSQLGREKEHRTELQERILGREVVAELQSLRQRVLAAKEGLEALDLKAQMEPFLHVAEAELSVVRASLDGLNQATATLCAFFCEDPETFSLAEFCGIFQVFGERFLVAAQENEAREAAERRRRQEQVRQEKKKRRSIATCSAQDPGLRDVELDLLFLGAPHSGRRSRSLRGPPPLSAPSPQARERPSHLSRRHTLPVLAPSPEPPPQEPPPPALPEPAPPSKAQRLFGQGLKAFLTAPPAGPSTEPRLPEASKTFRFAALFQKKLPPGAAEPPRSPQASPKDVSALVAFFRRLSTGDKP